jgi:hypothetical protein
MDLFSRLPSDIQREVLYFVDDKHLDKVESKVLEENDIFWKEKLFKTSKSTPSYKEIYQVCFDKSNKYFLAKHGHYKYLLDNYGWGKGLAYHALRDDFFLNNYIDYEDCRGYTLLMYFAYTYDENSIKTLVNCGANINKKNRVGLAALHFRCSEFLLSLGADPNIIRNDGLSLLMEHFQRPETMKALINHGADLNYKNKEQETVLTYMLKNMHPHNLSYMRGCIELLIDSGIDITIRDEDGLLAVDYFKTNIDINVYGKAEYKQTLKKISPYEEHIEDDSWSWKQFFNFS